MLDITPLDSQSSEPLTNAFTWSYIADAAEAALDLPRCSIISAPLFWTLGINSSIIHLESRSRISLSLLSIKQLLMSGYCVAEWFPHTINRLICSTLLFVFEDNMLLARFWSNLINEVMLSAGIFFEFFWIIRAFVFAGFPTTIIFEVFLALLSIISACLWKIFALSNNKSALCIPFDLGLAPTSRM